MRACGRRIIAVDGVPLHASHYLIGACNRTYATLYLKEWRRYYNRIADLPLLIKYKLSPALLLCKDTLLPVASRECTSAKYVPKVSRTKKMLQQTE